MSRTSPIAREGAGVLLAGFLAVAAFLAFTTAEADAETKVISVPATLKVESRTSSDGHNCGTRAFVEWPAQERAVAWRVYYFDNDEPGSDALSKVASPPFDDFGQAGDDPNRIWQAPAGFHWKLISQTSRSAPGRQVSCADFQAYHEARWTADRVDVTVEAPDAATGKKCGKAKLKVQKQKKKLRKGKKLGSQKKVKRARKALKRAKKQRKRACRD